jgi:hypothetical protein
MHEPRGTRVKARGCVVAIEVASTPGGEALEYGSAIVIGPHHLLTCAHVVATHRGKGPLHAEIRVMGSDMAIPPEQCEVDSAHDLALLRTNEPLDAPCARWLDNDSRNRWLRLARRWCAIGYDRTLRRLGSSCGGAWVANTDNDVQLHGGIPGSYSGGLLSPSKDAHQELAIGMLVLGGETAATSRALYPEAIQRFLDNCQSAITLERVAWRPSPSGHIEDFSSERARHGPRFGREDLLAQIRKLVENDGWVILKGSWGIGKSAVMHYLLQELEQSGSVPHHFIRRGQNYRDEPARVAENLASQLRWLFPEADEVPPHADLQALLKVISSQVLVPGDRRLTLLVDGLDEVAFQAHGNPLRFLPLPLPPRVSFVVASRPAAPHLGMFAEQPCSVLDLDFDQSLKESSTNACRQYLLALGESEDVARRLSEAVGGKFLLCKKMRETLGTSQGGSAVEQRLGAARDGIQVVFKEWWAQRVTDTGDGFKAKRMKIGLGYLCVARESLPRLVLQRLCGNDWSVDEFRTTMLPLLAPTAAGKDEVFAIDHGTLREFFVDVLDEPLKDVARRLADASCRWSDQRDGFERRYVLRHGLEHWRELGDWRRFEELALDAGYLEALCAEVGVDRLNVELDSALVVLGEEASAALRTLRRYTRARESALREQPRIFAEDFHAWCVLGQLHAHEVLRWPPRA